MCTLISINQIKLMTDLMYAATALVKGVGPIDYFLMTLDLVMMSYFQFLVYSTFAANEGRKSSELKSPFQQVLISNFGLTQSGDDIRVPLEQKMNVFETVRILIFLGINHNTLLFGITLFGFDLLLICYTVWVMIKHKHHQIKVLFVSNQITILSQSLFFGVLALAAICSSDSRYSSGFSTWLVVTFLIWIGVAFVSSVISFFYPNQVDSLKNYLKSKENFRLTQVIPTHRETQADLCEN